MKRYDSYKDSEIYFLPELPLNWKVRKAKYLFKEEKRTVRPEDEIVTCFRDGQVTLRKNRRTEGFTNSLKEIGYQGIRKGDLVIHNMDAFAGAIGISDSDGKGTPVYSCCTTQNEGVSQYYYCYLLRCLAKNGFILSLAKGIRERSTDFRFNDFKELYLPVPPRVEQDAIVSYLDATTSKIDAAIAQQKKMIDLLNERKQIIINNAVTKGLDPNVKMKPSGVDWIGDIPKHWEIRKFKTVSKVKSNLVHPYDFLSYPQISPDNIEKNTGVLINYNSVKESGIISDNHLFYKGQLIYSKIRPTLNKVIIAPFDGLCSADMYPIVSELNLDYLLFQMLSSFFNNQVQLLVNDRVKMPKINKEELGGVLLIVPPVNEQSLIADYIKSKISDIRNSLMHFETIISLLQERKQIIINDVVTGKVKVV